MNIAIEFCHYETEGIKEKIARLFEEIQRSTCNQEQAEKEEEMQALENGSNLS